MSYFRTVRISNPRFECDGLRLITVKSPALGGRGDIVIYSTPEATSTSPLVTLLHGVYGSCWSWAWGGGVHTTALRLTEENRIRPMHIAMPSDGLWGDGSGYVPHTHQNFEAWIVDDVPRALTEILALDLKIPRFISGLSMGGFGALRLGATYANRYAGISAHSAITKFAEMAEFIEEDLSLITPDPDAFEVFNVMKLRKDELPPLRFDCGTSDPLLENNRRLHEQLELENIEHTYEEFVGGHEWSYWEKNIEKSLIFFSDTLSP